VCVHGRPQRQTCKCCGYQDPFDFHVPDRAWVRVAPPRLHGQTVCLRCFGAMAAEAGVPIAAHLQMIYFAGEAATLVLRTADAG
jgi:hypothetical protein